MVKSIEMDFHISRQEIEILRELAKHVAELAARPIEEEKRKLWYRHNDLKRTRPLIFCDPENGWNEIITQDQIMCTDHLARLWEMHLRKEIFWGEEMLDDKVIESYFDIPYYYEDTGWGLVQEIIHAEAREEGGSYSWIPPLKDWKADFDNLKFPEIIVDYEKTNRVLKLAKEVFGDILRVRLKCMWWWSFEMTWTVINLRGLTTFMMDLYDNPGEVHRLMAFLRDGILSRLDFLEKNELLSLNTGGTYVGSGGFGWTRQLPQEDFNGKHVRPIDMWGFMESQETVGISAEMFSEFIFPYQKPILDCFGLNCYGCCEPLDRRWNVVKHIPRLRRVSSSPWADQAKMAEYLGDQFILSMKPNPAQLSSPIIDEEEIRKKIREDLRVTRQCIVEVIMKDNHTIGNNPNNVITWCRIAKEEALNI